MSCLPIFCPYGTIPMNLLAGYQYFVSTRLQFLHNELFTYILSLRDCSNEFTCWLPIFRDFNFYTMSCLPIFCPYGTIPMNLLAGYQYFIFTRLQFLHNELFTDILSLRDYSNEFTCWLPIFRLYETSIFTQ